jgi:hypothetical protein
MPYVRNELFGAPEICAAGDADEFTIPECLMDSSWGVRRCFYYVI